MQALLNILDFDHAADEWNDALPVGSGKFGAMVFGRVEHELIQCNEDSLWHGAQVHHHNSEAFEHLNVVRSAIFNQDPDRANALTREHLLSHPNYHNPYQPLCDLDLYFNLPKGKPIEQYRRSLDMKNGIVNVEYRCGGVDFKREVFASAVDDVLVVQLTASERACLDLQLTLMRRPFDPGTFCDQGVLVMRGQSGSDGVQYVVAVKTISTGGQQRVNSGLICIENADTVTLLISAATTFRHDDPHQWTMDRLSEADHVGFPTLKQRHKADHSLLFDRVSFDLGGGSNEDTVVDRLKTYRDAPEEADLGLVAMQFQYGRYLLMASSRPGSLPSNLQGIWCDQFAPAWESSYTMNVNLQMNYWPAEVANLSECHEPLFEFIERLAKTGATTAKVVYGARGWVAHHKSNLWADSGIECRFNCAVWPMGGAWLVQHMWEHFRFSKDTSFLRERAWPIMRASFEFFMDYLVESPDGHLVTGPSISPENKYITTNGEPASLAMGPTMDTQILRGLIRACRNAIDTLNIDDEISIHLDHVDERLPKNVIGSKGQILEWSQEYDEVEPGHRHVSHLWDVFPGSGITIEDTPKLAKAAKITLQRRLEHGGGASGWSRAWLINLWARLGEGNLASENIDQFLRHQVSDSLLCLHPPFQIDGNLGFVSAVSEMLLQSHRGDDVPELHLLPALPRRWSQGFIRGLKSRGQITVDLSWRESHLCEVSLVCDGDRWIQLKYIDKIRSLNMKAGEIVKLKFYGRESILECMMETFSEPI